MNEMWYMANQEFLKSRGGILINAILENVIIEILLGGMGIGRCG